MRTWLVVTLLGLTTLGAFAIRCLGIHNVFPSDGRVLIEIADGSFHARRALYTFVNFPDVLLFDPYLSHPDGAPVPVPPLYDWLLGAFARLFGDSVRSFEIVAAWVSPVLGTLTVLPVFAIGRRLGGDAVGLGAAAIYALLPMSMEFAGIGNADHHAAIPLMAAGLLALSLSLLDDPRRGSGLAGKTLATGAVQAAIALSWTGSLLFIALGSGALLLAAALAGRRDLLAAQGSGALAAAGVVGGWVAVAGTPYGGPFAGPLSWLQVVALAAAGAVGLGVAGLDAARPSRGPGETLARAFGIAALLGLALWMVPEVREALAPVGNVLARADTWGPTNVEQRPLFGWSLAWHSPVELYGLFAYTIPLAMLAPLLRARHPGMAPVAACAACWSAVLGALALLQVRFGGDFAPVAAVAFALLLAEVTRRVRRWRPEWAAPAAALPLLLAAAMLWPAVEGVHLQRLPRTLAWFGAPSDVTGDDARTSPKHTVVRFAEMVREATPETSGYLDDEGRPEYAVLAPPSFGHLVYYVARRPPTANNMGPYLAPEKFAATNAFFAASDEAEGLEIARSLDARYVLTAAKEDADVVRLGVRLHRLDGSARAGQDHLERFRLVVEGPRDGRPLRTSFPRRVPRRLVPYKLFERVEGAVIEAQAEPRAEGVAELGVSTSLGRRFVFRASAVADDAGRIRWRVPYATGVAGAVETDEAYRIALPGRALVAVVDDADVRGGRSIAAARSGVQPSEGALP